MIDEKAACIIERYNDFARKVQDMKLQEVAEMGHILNVSGISSPTYPALASTKGT